MTILSRALLIVVVAGLNVLAPLLWFFVVSLGLIATTGLPDACDLDGCGPASSMWQGVLILSILFIPVLVALFFLNRTAIRKYSALSGEKQTALYGASC